MPSKRVNVLQLPLTFSGNQYAVVFIDYFKWPEVFAVPNQKAETIARLLVECVISPHGVPELLLSDDHLPYLRFAYGVAVQESTQEPPLFFYTAETQESRPRQH